MNAGTPVSPSHPTSAGYAAPWGAQDHVADLGGRVHWVHWRGPDEGAGDAAADPILLVHGLGGNHLNWVLVGRAWARSHEVFALDLPGFGLSEGHPRDTGVDANAALVARFVVDIVGRPVTLIGNSMGGMISLIVATRRPDLVRRLVLVDPALPLPAYRGGDRQVAARFALFAVPGLGEAGMRRTRRYGAETVVREVMNLCFADPSRQPPDILEAHAALATEHGGVRGVERSFMRAARSLMGILTRRERYWRLMDRVTQPVLLIHGRADRLVRVGSAELARDRFRHWDVRILDGVGHVPQLEAPQETADVVSGWLAQGGPRT